jgi:hypothetical protein
MPNDMVAMNNDSGTEGFGAFAGLTTVPASSGKSDVASLLRPLGSMAGH